MVHKPRVNGTAPQYECLSRNVCGDCKGVGITDHIAERAVLDSLFAHIDSGGYSEAVDAYEFQEKRAPELRSLRSSLTKVEGKRVRLLHLYTEGRIEIAEYDAQVEPLNAQARELESQIERAEAGVRLPPVWKGDIRTDWEVLTLDEQRHALRLFAEKIEVASGGRGPGRVSITWR